MVPLENTAPCVSKSCGDSRWAYVLVVGVPNPRERACDTDGYGQIGDDPHD